MASLAHHFNFGNMSILSHQPPHLPSSSASIKAPSTTLSNLNRPNSITRPPLLSILQVQPSNSAENSARSSPSSADNLSPPLKKKPPPSSRENRRTLRSARADSHLTSPLHSNSSSSRSRRKHLSRNALHPDETDSNDDDYEPIQCYQRLKLSYFIPPSPPPAIFDNLIIPQSKYFHPYTPFVEPSYEIPRQTPNDTHTCIRTKVNPNSVSISSRPPAYFSKTSMRLNRNNQKSYSPPSPPDGQPPSLEMNITEEQEKWWYWCANCKITGDGNRSSHLPPLRCKDLKRKFDDFENPQEDDRFKIQTRPISESSLEQQKFYYSG